MNNNIENNNINLLWTGGWDSTFQLLQLLLIYQTRVTPFYLIDAERKSVGLEIRTMKRIKDQLFKDLPHTKDLLEPIRFHTVTDILPDSEITKAYQSILKKRHMGMQYEWLARFCKENGISDMQLSIQSHIRPNPASLSIEPIVSISNDGLRDIYVIKSKFKGTDEYKIFKYFSFPIIKTSKIQMATIADKHGWNKIMRMTWFCHNPTCSKKPCGKCKPCLIAIKEDFGWRIPPERRVISFYYRRIFWPLKDFTKSILRTFSIFE